jgi:hypothetical protein
MKIISVSSGQCNRHKSRGGLQIHTSGGQIHVKSVSSVHLMLTTQHTCMVET